VVAKDRGDPEMNLFSLLLACAPKQQPPMPDYNLMYQAWQFGEASAEMQMLCDEVLVQLRDHQDRPSDEIAMMRSTLTTEIEKYYVWGYIPWTLKNCLDELKTY